jgi:CBS domain-containing membrane protein
MRVEESMTKLVIYFTPVETLANAKHIMEKMNFRHAPIVESNRVVGMVSDRDILAASDANHNVPDKMLKEVMNSPVKTCHEKDSISSVVDQFLKNKIDSLPVVDDDGNLAGLITTTDLLWILKDPARKIAHIPYRFSLKPHDIYLAQAM